VAQTFRVPAFLLREAEIGNVVAAQGVPVADHAFPVVVFSPGDVSYRRQNTSWATELASHGYVVVALDHAFDSAVTVFQDGQATETVVRSSRNDEQDQAAADDQAVVRAEQLSSALDELTRRNTEPGALLEGHLDLTTWCPPAIPSAVPPL
jgi:predicted dienelactone hydrolase